MTGRSTSSILLKTLAAVRLRKAQALFLFLAADPNAFHRAEKVIDLFWQETDQQRAAASYRQVIRHIRRDMEADCGLNLKTEIGQITLEILDRKTPKDEFRETILAERWDAAAADRMREFLSYTTRLEGISNSFDSWLVITRSVLLRTIREALDERLANVQSARFDELRRPAELALELEPSNETAVRILMTLDWRGGHSTRAIERYDMLYRYLDEEFDQEPEAETIELLAAVKLNPAGKSARNDLTNRRPEVSISVSLLPSSDEIPGEMRGFGTVLFADLRMRMGRFREWRVLDEDSTESCTVNVKLRPVYGLGRYQLYVDVQRVEDSQLLWSEVIDSPETDWEAKARLLLANLANALSVVVSDRSLSDSGLAIYDRWLKAQALLDSWSPEAERAALSMLEDIIADTPKFGPAHAELAGALNVRHVLQPGSTQTEEVKQRALHHAIMAVSIDPLDTRAHRVVAWCYCHKREFGLAEFHFEQALNLNRSNPLTLASSALGFAFAGNLDRAAALVAETRRNSAVMEPFHIIYLAAADYLLGNYASAEEQCRRGTGLMPTVGGWHSLALWKLGRQDDSVRRLQSYFDEIRPKWQGDAVPGDAEIIDWFTSSFPLGDEKALADLHQTIASIMAARGAA
ncbi:BTAD domain-containing putative transcriptional regulator [Paracoccus marinaquae]|uniref:SARP family transcriptional regulator n=1 Tax=Paracoccus marinaquae TaxID=2841926 RepID=A0ABS6AHB4_9RHOB|nr:BTAD domain-containing putative transcriptional regulator [Paracoccus marinaquae]MBU3029899.1 SARP family transcriptional regulator [Paracoccus marinaquae]